MTITRQQAFDMLRADLRKFMARCEAAMQTALAHEIEGATSFDFNTGAINKASWVKFWDADEDKEARRRFLLWNKAGGKRLRGLAARREREADIIFLNRWPDAGSVPQSSPAIPPSEYKSDLANLGYLPKDPMLDVQTVVDAVKAFQRDKGLVVDGIVGSATRATLQRALATKRANQASAAAGAATGFGGMPLLDAVNGTTVLAIMMGVVVAGVVLGWAYRNRGRLFGIRAQTTDGEV